MKTNDVLFAKLITSRGVSFIVPKEFDGHIATNGFIGIRPSSRAEALMLWSILKSDVCMKQIYYLAATALQPELREEFFRNEFLIPIPAKAEDRQRLIKNARRIARLHEQVRTMVQQGQLIASNLFVE
jgi:hypothetical protein